MTGRADPPYPINDMTTDDPGALRETADLAMRVAVSFYLEREQANERIAAVLNMHTPSAIPRVLGDGARQAICEHCLHEYPCPTARALGVES